VNYQGPTRDEKKAFWGMMTGALLVVVFVLGAVAAAIYFIGHLFGAW
jgi:hypothetical protein